jgi:hypothetical protein
LGVCIRRVREWKKEKRGKSKILAAFLLVPPQLVGIGVSIALF